MQSSLVSSSISSSISSTGLALTQKCKDLSDFNLSDSKERLEFIEVLSRKYQDVPQFTGKIQEMLESKSVDRQTLQGILQLDFSYCRTTTVKEFFMPVAGYIRNSIFDFSIKQLAAIAKNLKRDVIAGQSLDPNLVLVLAVHVNILKHLQAENRKEFGFSDRTINKRLASIFAQVAEHPNKDALLQSLSPLISKFSEDKARAIIQSGGRLNQPD